EKRHRHDGALRRKVHELQLLPRFRGQLSALPLYNVQRQRQIVFLQHGPSADEEEKQAEPLGEEETGGKA
ncbi:unnamed protein product, partial [Amoebophrya sp. A120]